MGERRRPGRPGWVGHDPQDLEQRALTQLYAAHSAAVRTFVEPYLSDSQRVDDVVQETFLRAWRQIRRIDPDGNPRSFLFAIARNILIDQWRAQNRRAELLVGDDTANALPADDQVAQTLDTILINESIHRLSPQHREVIKALYFDDLTILEAADRLDVAVGTIKSRSYYAVRALRVVFDEMGLLR